jgi:hypothetical protein
MGIGLSWQAMRRPPGMPDTDYPLHRLTIEQPGKVEELAFRPPAFDASIDQSPNAGRIVPPVLEVP